MTLAEVLRPQAGRVLKLRDYRGNLILTLMSPTPDQPCPLYTTAAHDSLNKRCLWASSRLWAEGLGIGLSIIHILQIQLQRSGGAYMVHKCESGLHICFPEEAETRDIAGETRGRVCGGSVLRAREKDLPVEGGL